MPPKTVKKKSGVHDFGGGPKGSAKITKTGKTSTNKTPFSGTKRKIGRVISDSARYDETEDKLKKRTKAQDEDEAAYEPPDGQDDAEEDYSWTAAFDTPDELSDDDEDDENDELFEPVPRGSGWTYKKVKEDGAHKAREQVSKETRQEGFLKRFDRDNLKLDAKILSRGLMRS